MRGLAVSIGAPGGEAPCVMPAAPSSTDLRIDFVFRRCYAASEVPLVAPSRSSAVQRAVLAAAAVCILLYTGVLLGRMTPEPTGETVRWSGGPNYQAYRDLHFAASVAFAEHRYADSLRELDECKSLSKDGWEDNDTQLLRRQVMAALPGEAGAANGR